MNTTSYVKKLIFATILWTNVALSSATDISPALQGLTESQQFRVYPYVNKAYELQARGDWSRALLEIEKARRIYPEHSPLKEFEIDLSLSAGRDLDQIESLIRSLPLEKRSPSLLKLRLIQAQKIELDNSDIAEYLEGLNKQQRQLWIERRLFTSQEKKGSDEAYTWIKTQQRELKSLAVLRFEAYQAYAVGDYSGCTQIIKRIESESALNEQDERYLILSLLELNLAKQAKRYADLSPYLGTRILFKRSYSGQLIDNNQLRLAEVELEDLSKLTTLKTTEQAQLRYIRSLSEEQLSTLEQFGSIVSECLKQTLEVSATIGRERAKSQLKRCNPQTTPEAWLVAAQQIGAYDQIAAAKFSDARLQSKQRQVLIGYYRSKNNVKQLVRIFSEKKTTANLISLANVYGANQDHINASKTWLELYVKTQDIKYAELSSYHAERSKSPDLQATVIGWIVELTPQKAMQSDSLVSRARALINKDISALSLQSVVMISANSTDPIDPAIWQAQSQCSTLMLSDDEDKLLQRGKALCLQYDAPLEAAALLEKVDDFSQNADDNRLMARLLYRGERYTDSVDYWSKVPSENKSLFDAYAHLDSLAKSQMWQETEALWSNQSLYLNPNWWLIGISAAEKLEQPDEVRFRTQRAFTVTGNATFAVELAKLHIESGNLDALEVHVDNILALDKKGDSSAQVAYLLLNTHPDYAQKLFENATKFPLYENNIDMQISYADVLAKQGRVWLAKNRYQQVIDQQRLSLEQQTYVQRAHRELKQGWKYSLAGWVGRSDGIGVPGFTGRAGDFFSFANANYYFNEPVVPGLALSLSSLVSGQFESKTTAEWDVSAEVKPFDNLSYFVKAGVRNRVVDNDRRNSTYVRFSADVFSNDSWSKSWQPLNNKWLYQQLYLDGLQYLDGTQNYALYGRYELGQTLKLSKENKYRLTPYTFFQASSSNTGEQHQQDARAGIGGSLRWQWFKDPYDGLSVDTEIGLEWQRKLKSNQDQDSANSLLLRYALYF